MSQKQYIHDIFRNVWAVKWKLDIFLTSALVHNLLGNTNVAVKRYFFCQTLKLAYFSSRLGKIWVWLGAKTLKILLMKMSKYVKLGDFLTQVPLKTHAWWEGHLVSATQEHKFWCSFKGANKSLWIIRGFGKIPHLKYNVACTNFKLIFQWIPLTVSVALGKVTNVKQKAHLSHRNNGTWKLVLIWPAYWVEKWTVHLFMFLFWWQTSEKNLIELWSLIKKKVRNYLG